MWSDWKDRYVELVDKAKFFEYEGYQNTGKWLRYLADQVGVKRPVADLEKDLDDTLASWRSEYVKGNPIRGSLLDAIWTVLSAATRSGMLAEELRKLDPVIRELASNAQHFIPIGEAFRPYKEQGNRKGQFYGTCILYLLNVEGMFDQAVRSIYGLVSIAKALPVPSDLGAMSLWDIRKELVKIGMPEVLFAGWENGHVRNSISHCHFRYDDRKAEMRFWDIDRQGKTVHDRSFTIEQFQHEMVTPRPCGRWFYIRVPTKPG